ncbi:hypothetical protein DZG01_30225 [Pseudomonas fluorescens]|nr:hypothetical protein DZG01_30225 [Pseudomonas fluorescens]
MARFLWRGSLLPLGREAAPKKAMSASHSSGSKLPRHKAPPLNSLNKPIEGNINLSRRSVTS